MRKYIDDSNLCQRAFLAFFVTLMIPSSSDRAQVDVSNPLDWAALSNVVRSASVNRMRRMFDRVSPGDFFGRPFMPTL